MAFDGLRPDPSTGPQRVDVRSEEDRGRELFVTLAGKKSVSYLLTFLYFTRERIMLSRFAVFVHESPAFALLFRH